VGAGAAAINWLIVVAVSILSPARLGGDRRRPLATGSSTPHNGRVSRPQPARLPVRTGADVHLADALGLPGCPLCRERGRTEVSYLESILAESVNDVPFRQALDAARGFCGRHAAEILDADRRRAGSLGAAILLRATLAPRLRELEAATSSNGRGRARRVHDAARPPACPACERAARADAGVAESLVRHTADPAWADAVAGAPVCLDHLLALMAVRSAPPAWAAVEARQLARLTDLRDRLDAYAHTSSHDRRHRQTEAQRASPDEAAAVLAGRRRPMPDATAHAPDASDTTAAIPADARAVLLSGVYGTGKSTTAVELVDRLDTAGVPAAAIDLDWLNWFGAPIDWDEHEDPRIGNSNLAAMRANYLEVGVRSFVLAGTVRSDAQLAGVRAALGVPLAVVRLDAPPEVIRARLSGDPNASRADDLEVATRDLADGAAAAMPADWVVDSDRPTAVVTDEILRLLGWLGTG
jgi:hypothetical protein